MKILITGMAGSGKTSIISRLSDLGFKAIDMDSSNVCSWVNKKTGEETLYKEGAGRGWIEEQRYQVVISKLLNLMDMFPVNENIFVGGKISKSQVEEIVKIFDTAYLLKPQDSVINERLSSKITNRNNFAKTEDERNLIVKNRGDFEKKCLDSGFVALENNGDISETIEKILFEIEEK